MTPCELFVFLWLRTTSLHASRLTTSQLSTRRDLSLNAQTTPRNSSVVSVQQALASTYVHLNSEEDDAATCGLEHPHPLSRQRVGWLRRVDKLIGKAEGIKAGLNCFTWCYSGKEADKELKKAEELASEGKDLLKDARERPRPVRDVRPQERLWGMDSYKKAVLHFTNDEDYNSRLLGIWGMGGVGKSSLLLHYSSTSEHGNHNFHPILFVEAGRGCTVGKLQEAIANTMGLPLLANEASQEAIIFNHLKDKSFLLLLDDLWGYLDLKAIGVPMPLRKVSDHRCKVVFTTRSLDVCGKMGCRENTIRMECLSKGDAWELFKNKAGDKLVDDAKIRPHAEKIVEECSGLPMALCMIGQIMSAKKYHQEWRNTKNLLKSSKIHIIDRHEDFVNHLNLSCDNMIDEDMKRCFLLCSLWPENENISMEELIRWWTGLGLLDGFPSASHAGYSFIKDLVRASMLEKGDNGLHSTENSHVKMHNMIRKIALWMANDHGCKNNWLPNSSNRSALAENKWSIAEKAWVSQEDTSRWCQWYSTARFTKLKMLVGRHLFSLNVMVRYFQLLTFLDLEGMRRGGFPLEICQLTKLEYLNLSATRIDVLPLDLIKLIFLKYLYIRNNKHLKTIQKGLILALEFLLGLDLFCTDASFPSVLTELASSRSRLSTMPEAEPFMLGITVQTVTEIINLGQLQGVCMQALCMHDFKDDKDPAIINLQLLSIPEQLQELSIKKSSHIEVLVTEGGSSDDQWLLPCLEIFELNNLLKLEKVKWKNTGMDIRVVSINNCDKLKDVTWVQDLKFLEQLTVAHCKGMETLIETGESPQGVGVNQRETISFPRLQKLKLEYLPKLSMICNQACEFEKLSYICVTRCNHMRNIQYQMYKQSIVKIDCSKDWWNRTTLPEFESSLVPTFCS